MKHTAAFTLIELLIVIAILSLLMAIVVISINPAEMLKKSRDAKRISSIKNLSLGRKDWASLEEFNSFLIKTDDKCVLIDSYTVYDNYGSEIGKTYFLRPDKTLLMGETLSENYGFHKISIFWSGLYFVGDLAFLLLLVLLVAYIISFFYHKVVLYIIFGKYNI